MNLVVLSVAAAIISWGISDEKQVTGIPKKNEQYLLVDFEDKELFDEISDKKEDAGDSEGNEEYRLDTKTNKIEKKTDSVPNRKPSVVNSEN